MPAKCRAVVWVRAAIVAMDRGEVADFRRHARVLAADPADEGPAQVWLAAELFAGHLAVLEGRTDAGLARLRTVCAQLAGGQAHTDLFRGLRGGASFGVRRGQAKG